MILDFQSIKSKLHERLSLELPGLKAHELMKVPGRGDYPLIPEKAKKAAVLLIIYKKLDFTFLAFIKRVTHEKDRHSGQISFPGGSIEASDDYPIQTAIREANEEMGIPMEVEIAGNLSPLYIPVSGFYVSPVVATYEQNFRFTPQISEVEEILEIDLQLLFKPSVKSKVNIPVSSNFLLREVPCYNIQGTIIWGATAMILSELEWVLKN